MNAVTVSRTLHAAPGNVWRVLADYPSIANWNRNVKASRSTNGQDTGLGAQRYCKMSPVGSIVESISDWQPEHLMTVRIDKTRMIPIAEAVVHYRVSSGADSHSTDVEVHYEFTPKWGPLGRLMAPSIAKQLASAFEDVVTDLETAAQQ